MTSIKALAFTYSLAWLLLPATPVAGKVTILPDVLHDGPVTDETVAGSTSSLDGQKLSSSANETSYEWWYFDAVATDSLNESLTIIFYNSGPAGFPGGYMDGPLSVSVSGSFDNGTAFNYQVPASIKAVIKDDLLGVVGDFKGSGAQFFGSSLSLGKVVYDVEVNSPELGIYGRMILNSRAPPRYSCEANVPGANELAFRDVGWANAIPDSDALVDILVGDTRLCFIGIGYHDKNWGLTPFSSNVEHFYWGHARVGPYSVVWFDGQVPDDEGNLQEVVSGTAAKGGKLLTTNCDEGAVSVRPWGENDAYPPTVATGPPQGLEVRIDLGEEGTLALNITSELITLDEANYQRFVGEVRGGLVGGDEYEGKSLYEQFVLIESNETSGRRDWSGGIIYR